MKENKEKQQNRSQTVSGTVYVPKPMIFRGGIPPTTITFYSPSPLNFQTFAGTDHFVCHFMK